MRDKEQRRHDTRPGAKRRNRIAGQFVSHPVEMIVSPAWRVLSLSARRALDQLEIEHCAHGAAENGRLKVPYNDFEHKAGIHRHCIRPAIGELEALGFIEITRKGRAARDPGGRVPTLYRLTFVVGVGNSPDPTHEWRKVKSLDDAERIAKGARAAKSPAKSKIRKPMAETAPKSVAKTATEKQNYSVAKTAPQQAAESAPLSISRGGWSGGGGGRKHADSTTTTQLRVADARRRNGDASGGDRALGSAAADVRVHRPKRLNGGDGGVPRPPMSVRDRRVHRMQPD